MIHISKKSHLRPSTPLSLCGLSLALGLAVLAIPHADAAVVYSDFADVTSGPDTDPENDNIITSSFTLNLSFDPFALSTGPSSSDPFATFITFMAFESGTYEGESYYYPAAVSTSGAAMVSSSLLSVGSEMNSGNTVAGAVPAVGGGADFYIGLRFADPATVTAETPEGSNFRYGWARFSTGAESGIGGPVTLTLKDAAIETEIGKAIKIGDAVPEPSGMAMLGLVGGAAALRRRRRQARAAV